MVVSDEIHNIMGGIESAGDVRLHNHRRKLKQRFDIVKKLGQGTYGRVQLGINKETGQEVAIKTIRKCKIETDADLIRIRREIQIMSSVRHPNIIHIYEVFENREKMVLVMEYAAGGELYDYLSERKVLTEEEARRIFRQIASAVYYCHKHNICHRDLKLENILLDEAGNAKIADFGLSNVFSYSSLLSTFCGSPLYASPEIVKGTPYVGPEVDCWSLGVLLYTLVYGAMPFDGSNFKRLVKQISQGDYFEPKCPSPASPLISEMLNVNPAHRANVKSICSHPWINETYSDLCLDVAEDLARQTPVRLDLLLSLTAPAVNSEKIVVGADQAAESEDLATKVEKPIRSQSLGSIPPSSDVQNVAQLKLADTKEPTADEKKSKPKSKERSHSKTRKKERSHSRSRKSGSHEGGSDAAKASKTKDKIVAVENDVIKGAGIVNSGTQVIVKPADGPEIQIELAAVPSTVPVKIESKAKKEDQEYEGKPVAPAESKIAEKSNAEERPSVQASCKKTSSPSINVEKARREFERGSSVASDGSSPRKKTATPSPTTPREEPFPLASTIALNKLVESAFRDEPEFDFKATPSSSAGRVGGAEDRVAPRLMSSTSAETKLNDETPVPKKTSRAEIHLVTPKLKPDSYKTEVEHFVNKPAVSHKTEIVIPVSAPLPPKPLSKIDNQSKEHIIPIKLEDELPRRVTSPSPSWSASRPSIARTSSSSLSRQSTVDSDSGSNISIAGEPIRKSPREMIIPIAIEGGGYVTPRADTLSRKSSLHDDEDEDKNGNRYFTLRSTKRRQPQQSSSGQLDAADSLSSDEDDNFQQLTAENLFSTLLSRMRDLTQRLNHDEMRRSSGFPRTLFSQHGSFFDNFPSRRLCETRSFGRSDNSPWRRSVISNSPSQRENLVTVHVPTVLEDKPEE